jgi:hypothetical protein
MRTLLIALTTVVITTGLACAEKPAAPVGKAPAAVATTISAATSRTPAKAVAENRGPSKRVVAQQEAMKALSFLDGEWRGASKTLRKAGWAPMVQTVRSGLMLDGTVRMIEVRGYESDGSVGFNSLRIICYDPDSKTYSMRAYQNGSVRDYDLETSATGLAWEIGGKEGATRYETSVRNGGWNETATRSAPRSGAKGERETYLSISMKRLRAGVWPQAGAIGMK